jgi:lipid-binding SYLF domain-containing protein
VGRHASAGTDWKLNTQILTYSRSRGVFAGITLEGAVVEQDNDSTRAIYGHDLSFGSILSGKIAAPKSTMGFMRAIAATDHAATIAEVKPDMQ